MLFSHSAAYVVRALVWLACQPKDGRWLATDFARLEGIPQPYLRKALASLSAQGIMASTRGPKGGDVLASDPDTISLMKVSELFDAERRVSTWLLAYGECGSCSMCPIGDLWENSRASIRSTMESTTIGSMAERSRQRNSTNHI